MSAVTGGSFELRFSRLLRRSTPAGATTESDTKLATRAIVRRCFSCQRSAPVYVYAENGNDYCLRCAAASYGVMGLRPAGRRDDDLTLQDLIQHELQTRSPSSNRFG